MIRSNILLTALACVFLAGQIPYGYLYCTAMKQALDARMLRCCSARQPDGGAAVSCPAEFRIRHIDKNTTDRSDERQHSFTERGGVFAAATDHPACDSLHTIFRPYNLPLPDIVIGQHNLRI